MDNQGPLTMDELESLAVKRIEIFKKNPPHAFGPPHIAVIHARTGHLEFSAGISTFQGIDSIVSPSLVMTTELWDFGKQAAYEMYNDNAWDLAEVNLLATIIIDGDSPRRHMWVNSPGVSETIEVVLHGEGHAEVGVTPEKKWSFPIECGFNIAKTKLEIEEQYRWN